MFRGNGKYPEKFGIQGRTGMNRFSNETVALHLRDMDEKIAMDEVIYRTHDLVSGLCDTTRVDVKVF